jgi:hypothetical protein
MMALMDFNLGKSFPPTSYDEALEQSVAEAMRLIPDYDLSFQCFSEKDFEEFYQLIVELRNPLMGNLLCVKYLKMLERAYLQLKNWE